MASLSRPPPLGPHLHHVECETLRHRRLKPKRHTITYPGPMFVVSSPVPESESRKSREKGGLRRVLTAHMKGKKVKGSESCHLRLLLRLPRCGCRSVHDVHDRGCHRPRDCRSGSSLPCLPLHRLTCVHPCLRDALLPHRPLAIPILCVVLFFFAVLLTAAAEAPQSVRQQQHDEKQEWRET